MKDISYYKKCKTKFKFKCRCGHKTTNQFRATEHCPGCGMSVYEEYLSALTKFNNAFWHEAAAKKREFHVDQCEKLGIETNTVLQITAGDFAGSVGICIEEQARCR